MTESQRIQDQLKRSLEGPAWHGPALLELLGDVTPQQAAARPLAQAHSIWELVLHIAAWVQIALRRLNGDAPEVSPDQDWPPITETGESAWAAALAGLRKAHAELLERINRIDDSHLGDIVPGQRYSVYFMLHGVVQHNLYHGGQIALLKKALTQ